MSRCMHGLGDVRRVYVHELHESWRLQEVRAWALVKATTDFKEARGMSLAWLRETMTAEERMDGTLRQAVHLRKLGSDSCT